MSLPSKLGGAAPSHRYSFFLSGGGGFPFFHLPPKQKPDELSVILRGGRGARLRRNVRCRSSGTLVHPPETVKVRKGW